MGASRKHIPLFAAAAAGLAGLAIAAAPARAESIQELQLDVNSITIQATNLQGANTAFGGAHHNGKLVFTLDRDSTIGLYLNGAAQTSFNASFFGLSGEITFLDGLAQGGSMTVKVQNPDTTIDSYSFDIAGGSQLTRPIGQSSYRLFGFQLDADTVHGHFNDNNYGGTDIASFYAAQNPGGLQGAFFQLKYVPNASGYSNTADIDILTVAEEAPSFSSPVPLPSSAAAGLGLAGLLAVAQWRRNAARH